MNSLTAVSKAELIEAIRNCGSDNEEYFGYPVKEDGLFLQQDPEEFASFVEYLVTKCPPSELSCEVGIAAGGNTKFVRDYYDVKKTIIVDIGLHPQHFNWKRIKPQVKTEFVLEVIDDSHSANVRKQLLPYAGQIDYAFVDGDHTYKGLRQDIFLMKEVLKPGAIMTLHDTAAVEDCHNVYLDLLKSKDFELQANFISRFGISVWKFVGTKNVTSNMFNRRFGWGNL
ncbi:MAG: hypothetical protein GC184_05580 [Rhizobiales bacterium]|nr:hypothetical protein [Hyphomicrobiales bacterium]